MDEEDEVKTPKQLAKEKQAEEWAAFMVKLAPAKAVVKSILDSVWFNVITGFLTTFALFGDDVRIMAFTGEGSADLAFSVINLFTMFWFVLEIIGNSFAKNDYFNGFYFWLDIVSTASMIFDIKLVRSSKNARCRRSNCWQMKLTKYSMIMPNALVIDRSPVSPEQLGARKIKMTK